MPETDTWLIEAKRLASKLCQHGIERTPAQCILHAGLIASRFHGGVTIDRLTQIMHNANVDDICFAVWRRDV